MPERPSPIDFAKLMIARKLSVLEYDQRKYGLTESEAIARYRALGADVERIQESHQRQLDNFKKITQFFPDAHLVVGETLTKNKVADIGLVISFGGDNYFQYLSHFLDKQLMVGMNADPVTSEGALLYFQPDNFGDLSSKLKSGNFQIEEWTRLKATANGNPVRALAVSEIYIGARERLAMSRYHLELDGQEEDHKDSGLLIATGAGSTGWYHSALSCQHQEAETFSKTTKEARFIETETFYGKLSSRLMTRGVLKPGEKLTVTWYAHERGILSIDSQPRFRLGYRLDRGTRVTIELADKPLLVVSLK